MMVFASQWVGVRVPKIYALYRDDDGGDGNVIVMERIRGAQNLQDRWATLNNDEKNIISTRLREIVVRMRAVASPNGTYCSLDNKPLRDTLFWTGREEESLGCDGPFTTEQDLNNALIKKCRASAVMKGKADLYDASLPVVFRDHAPVLTHGDLQRKNIMLLHTSTDTTTIMSSTEIVILDWEFAGWYPNYWEFVQTIIACGFFEDDWHQWVTDKILEPFWAEYAWVHMLSNEIGW